MAGDPASGSRVGVGPPWLPSGDSRGSPLVRLTPSAVVTVPSRFGSPAPGSELLLPATMEFFKTRVPASALRSAPSGLPRSLPEMVQASTVSEP